MISTLKNRFAAALGILVLVASTQTVAAQGFDRIRDRNGTTSGKITKMSALAVTYTKGGVETKKPAEEILSITFAGEPEELSPARRSAKAGRFENALQRLGKINRNAVTRKEIAQEIAYLTAYCQVQQALSGQGTLDQARQQVTRFISRHGKSYHLPQAIELLGDVLLASENYSGARDQYKKLGKAPAPYFKVRSAILVGRALQAEGKHQDAIQSFDLGLQAVQGNAVAKTQTLEATLHRAVSQSALGEMKTSTDAVKKIIAQADAKNIELLAQAYNALGDCYLRADKKKEARQAFLHVDLLFNAAAKEHAKALHELSQLWSDLGQSDRAKDANNRLQKMYPGSRWAQR